MQRRVLLVHGDSAVQDLTVRALARIGVGVDVHGHNGDPFDTLDERRYSTIVIDRSLSGSLLSVIAAHPHPRPIVIVTASTEESKELDPETVNLIVPAPYDAHALVGVILACVTGELPS